MPTGELAQESGARWFKSIDSIARLAETKGDDDRWMADFFLAGLDGNSVDRGERTGEGLDGQSGVNSNEGGEAAAAKREPAEINKL